MDNRLKLKLFKLFQTCRPKHISDVSAEPFFFPETRHHRQLIALFSPKTPPSFSKPNYKPTHPKISNQTPSFSSNKPIKKKPHYRKPKKIDYISSTTDSYYYDWRSSDDDYEDEKDETSLLSSFRSESSGSSRRYRANRKSNKKVIIKRRSGKLVKDSFAVEKKSSNPYEDFRVSMVEMIVEKRIFEVEELMKLFECFISLNSDEHHRVICEVFSEILDALFSGLELD